ncbi:cytochrome P450 [Pluteus cervinus]|uniref:Cytochrome P450 n=1 Tax=Pluteus cervinus TaxID=181527 RepID=A0ACD3ABD6_9AGAR|nr:cytochrome P450 [Pluteus cervinus]
MADHLPWIVCSLLLACAFVVEIRRKNRLPRPPGPKPWPLIGNALEIPQSRSWLTYTEWGRRYNSSLLYMSALGQHLLVINSIEDAVELLDERAPLTSDRPTIPILDMMGWESNTGLIPYGTVWRRHRKMLHQNLRKDVLGNYDPVMAQKSLELLHKFAEDPDQFMQHCKVYGSAIIMGIIYGYDLVANDDQLFLRAEHALKQGSQALLPGAFAVNTFPFLRHIPRWFPGGGFHDWAAGTKKLTLQMRNAPFDLAKEDGSLGKRSLSLVSKWLYDGNEKVDGEEDVVRDVAYAAFSAGLDTTPSTMLALIHALALHPEVQRKAYEEIVRVVGTSRLPTCQDRPSMPYLEAIYREILRWRPPVPLGVPHKSTQQEIMYKGYCIPPGTVIISNIWAMTRNEALYPDAEAFRPERFLNPDGTLNNDERVLAYGFGRRVCAGKYLAAEAVWLAMACITAAFHIGKPKDGKGNELALKVEYTDEAITRPAPFKCSITLRRDLGNLNFCA